jgi:hypothetical protein
MTMTARRGALLSAFALASVLCVSGEDFRQGFGGRYADALRYVETRADAWCIRLASLGADPHILVPVIFPELLKYTMFRDDVEILGLAMLYVSGGTARGNFSIGRFQMKPSFVEALEAEMVRRPDLPAGLQAIAEYPAGTDAKGKRTIRIDRLRSEAWQVTYLAGFFAVLSSRFDLAALPTEERLRFVAAAYNRGFWYPAAEIKRAEGLRIFPRGAGGSPGPYRYTDIAVDFFEAFWDTLYTARAGLTLDPGGSSAPP